MNNLPDAREDGNCCECGSRDVVTRDGRYCKRCLKKLVAGLSPIPKQASDQIGRSQRSSNTLGGSAEMREDGWT